MFTETFQDQQKIQLQSIYILNVLKLEIKENIILSKRLNSI